MKKLFPLTVAALLLTMAVSSTALAANSDNRPNNYDRSGYCCSWNN